MVCRYQGGLTQVDLPWYSMRFARLREFPTCNWPWFAVRPRQDAGLPQHSLAPFGIAFLGGTIQNACSHKQTAALCCSRPNAWAITFQEHHRCCTCMSSTTSGRVVAFQGTHQFPARWTNRRKLRSTLQVPTPALHTLWQIPPAEQSTPYQMALTLRHPDTMFAASGAWGFQPRSSQPGSKQAQSEQAARVAFVDPADIPNHEDT